MLIWHLRVSCFPDPREHVGNVKESDCHMICRIIIVKNGVLIKVDLQVHQSTQQKAIMTILHSVPHANATFLDQGKDLITKNSKPWYSLLNFFEYRLNVHLMRVSFFFFSSKKGSRVYFSYAISFANYILNLSHLNSSSWMPYPTLCEVIF